MKVYLAGPIENADREKAGLWRERAAYLLQAHGIESLCPIRDGANTATGHWTPGGRSLADCELVVKRDLELIDMSDVVLVNLSDFSEGVFSEGTCMEVFYSWERHKIVVAFGYGRRSAFMSVCINEFHECLEKAVEAVRLHNRNIVFLNSRRDPDPPHSVA